MNHETIIDTLSWYMIWQLNGFNRIRAKPKLLKFLEPTRKPKVIYTDDSLDFGKSCEELTWNHCTSTPQRSATNGIAERAVRRVKRMGHLQYCCNQVWMKNGEQVPWSVTAVCETCKISCLMGRRHMKGGSECSPECQNCKNH